MSRISASALLGTVILAFSVAPNTAQACWGCCGPRVWYPGPLAVVTAWTPCWSTYDLCSPCDICVDPCCDVVDPCCDVEWVLGVRPGPIRRFLFGPYRWYPVVGEACTVCGAAPCDCGAQVLSMPPSPTPSPQPAPQPAPNVSPSPQPAPATPGPGPGVSPNEPPMAPSAINPTSYSAPLPSPTPSRANSGLITVYVPAEAKVIINGIVTKSTGTRREYVSYGLAEGLQYKYTITAQVERDGKVYEETREVILTAGAKKGVAFSFQFPSENLAGVTSGDRL
ncbi:TIGR03000 domain-containing protein [Thermogutta sp.]|uniref:TIGR03000 domain-containing protein n=1 Tax=Thermogutta sp. TaxID=1962930 RepID=UPI003C7A3367